MPSLSFPFLHFGSGINLSPELNNQNRIPSTSMSESPSIANIQNKHNRDQQYLAVRAQQNSRNSNSVDSGSFKAEGNGKCCRSVEAGLEIIRGDAR